MEEFAPFTIIAANDNRFQPVAHKKPKYFGDRPLAPDQYVRPYEKIIENDEGIRVEALSDDRGHPIVAISRINLYGDVLFSDGTNGGITCYHHDQFVVVEHHKFGLFAFEIEAEVSWAGLIVKLSRLIPDSITAEPIETKKIYWKGNKS